MLINKVLALQIEITKLTFYFYNFVLFCHLVIIVLCL